MAESYIDVDRAIKQATELIAEQKNLHKRMGIVRTDLRNAVELKVTNAEQTAFVREHFPVRTRKTKAKAQAS